MIRVFTSKTQRRGEEGEAAAVDFLKNKGFSIVARNVANSHGEIDIVAKKKGIHYFFEVKAGIAGGWMNPAENLTKKKLAKIYRSVEYYCLMNKIVEYRVEGIVVLFGPDGTKVEILDIL